jgi:hypothetical protein
MRVELLPGSENVFRFPLERCERPTLDLLREIAPDVRQVLNLAEVFGIDPPVTDLRERTDAATAEHIANHVPADLPARDDVLRGMQAEVVTSAVAAVRAARDAWSAEGVAQQSVLDAQNGASFQLWPLKMRADHLAEQAAVLTLEARALSEQAEGVARAVGFALRDEPWTPRNVAAEAMTLFDFPAAG